MSRTLVLIALTIVFSVIAPLQTALVLGIAGVVVLVGGYVAVAALTAAVILPLLIAGSTGVRGPVLAASIVAAAIVFPIHRGSIRRLRAGQEPRLGRFGNAPLAPGEQPGVGLWAKPAPHGLLGPSAMSVGAVLTIVAAIAISVMLAARFG
jgi:hypothetical protein